MADETEKSCADQVLIDPKWKWGICEIGSVRVPFVSLIHPVHGLISALVPRSVMMKMGEDFTKLAGSGGENGGG